MIAGDEKPELARGGSHSIAQVLQRAYVHHGGQIRAVHHVEKILINDDGRAVGVRLRDGREWQARLAVVSNADPYSTLVEMVGEDYLPRTFYERVKDIQLDEFSYFQVHLALKAPVRYALHEATIRGGPSDEREHGAAETRGYRSRCGTRFAPASFPSKSVFTRSVRRPSIRSSAHREACRVSLFAGAVSAKGKKPEDWVKLKTVSWRRVLKFWRRYATNLTDENITMKAAMEPFYMSGRWPNMRRGSVWGARKILHANGRAAAHRANFGLPHADPRVCTRSAFRCISLMR